MGFPNQPQALAAMEDLASSKKTEMVPVRFIRVHVSSSEPSDFAPDDAMVRAIYAYYYARGPSAEARRRSRKAESADDGALFLLSSVCLDREMKDYERALEAAKGLSTRIFLPG